MTLVIDSKSALGKVTRLLTEHPEWCYRTHGGDNGEIVIEVEAS